MSAIMLANNRVEKPWGRNTLWTGFSDVACNSQPVGEIWFTPVSREASKLLVKYLFTAEPLSIQVHPNDQQAHKAGLPFGKDEAWVILAADANASIALGPSREITKNELRTSALDGSIERLMNWVPVRVGDMVYSPAGTVHAIGAGLTLVEIQQNLDLTYRLYDYGSARTLDLEEAIEVSSLKPFVVDNVVKRLGPGRTLVYDKKNLCLKGGRGTALNLSLCLAKMKGCLYRLLERAP